MDARRVGSSLRALRIRRRIRQIDVARAADISRGTISNIERGLIRGVSVGTLLRCAVVLGADLDVRVRWRGADLDRLLDEGHARLVNSMSQRLTRAGWDVAVEVTFSEYGERGSIDLLAFHSLTRDLLAVEVKTVVPDLQATLSALDRKTRLARTIAAKRGWTGSRVSRLLAVEAGSTSRDRVARLEAAIGVAFPDRGQRVRSWLRSPDRAISGLLFVRSATPGSTTQHVAGRQRVRILASARTASGGGASQR